MAYMLLAIGVLMSIAGVHAMVTGYHIVQIEEGWSSVIAGATLFVGGFLVIGLGIIQRTLAQLTTILAARPILAPALDAVVPAAGEPLSKIEPQIEDRLRPDRPKRAPLPIVAPSPTPPAIPEPLSREPVHPEPLRLEPSHSEFVDHELPAPQSLVSTDPAPDEGHQTPHAPASESTPDAGTPDLPPADDDYELETPSTPEHDLVAADAAPSVPEPAGPEPARDDDWLDRAFAEFDQDLPKSPSAKTTPPNPTPTKPALPKTTFPKILTPKILAPKISPAPAKSDPLPEVKTPHSPEPEPEFEHAFAEPEPVAAEALEPVSQPLSSPSPIAPPPPLPGHGASVIGRYESEGTTYVMYADGSIEAHSDAGVYRFGSMAELKAFIEK